MGLFALAAAELRERFVTTNPQDPAYWVGRLFGGSTKTASGKNVSPDSAMKNVTFFVAVRNLAEDVGGLPVPIYERSAKGRREAREQNAWTILNVNANPEMPAHAYRETITGHAIARGTGYGEKQFDNLGRVMALWPLNPAKMRWGRNGQDGLDIAGAPTNQLVYVYTLPSGQEKVFAPKLLHRLRGFGPNGIEGYSVVRLAAEALGLAAAAEEYGARFFANDGAPGVYLKTAGRLSKEAAARLKASWDDAHAGLDNAHRTAILEEGLEVGSLGLKPEDAQLLGTRAFQRIELTSLVRMPPTKIGDLTHGTYSNTEQEDIAYVKWTVRAWANRWDQSIVSDAIVPEDYYAEHNLQGVLQGDSKSRGEFYQALRAAGGITSNQIADRENFPRSDAPGADELWFPLANAPASAFDSRGMTWPQKTKAAADLVRVGYDPAAVLAALGLPEIAHTGKVPTSLQLPDSLAL